MASSRLVPTAGAPPPPSVMHTMPSERHPLKVSPPSCGPARALPLSLFSVSVHLAARLTEPLVFPICSLAGGPNRRAAGHALASVGREFVMLNTRPFFFVCSAVMYATRASCLFNCRREWRVSVIALLPRFECFLRLVTLFWPKHVALATAIHPIFILNSAKVSSNLISYTALNLSMVTNPCLIVGTSYC
jgi:hypothetical protein